MPVISLQRRTVTKPWGRSALPPPFDGLGASGKVGEIWFPAPAERAMPILVKYLFTSEKLSVQVHPNDAEARARGLAEGKEECWYILDAEPGAKLGIGTREAMDADALREAAATGAIEHLLEWHEARPGTLYYLPSGTVHAIGAGVSLIEVQQNADVTYRLYDYGRPRELHLDDGLAVARAEPMAAEQAQPVDPGASRILLETPHFTLAHIAGGDLAPIAGVAAELTLIPVAGQTVVRETILVPGDCALASGGSELAMEADARAFVAWPPA